MTAPAILQQEVSEALAHLQYPSEPAGLYDPVRYMLSLGGKRMRPVLLLMSCELFGGNRKDALKAALGVEVFHNFTLLHDDIMDEAPLRRSMPTVHEKWNTNIAILSGDAMFVDAVKLVMQVPDQCIRPVLELFNKTALEVCEGQQYDMDFQSMNDVSIDAYLHMIRLKTAVLLGGALGIGALVANADKEAVMSIYDFGVNLGVAFQLQDDILDVYADAAKFGKRVGGDIVSNKKTFLLLTALQDASGSNREELLKWLRLDAGSGVDEEKVEAVKAIYDRLSVREKAEKKMQELYQTAFRHLDEIPQPAEHKAPLRRIAEELMTREN